MDDKKRISYVEDRIKELEWKFEAIEAWILQKFGEDIPLDVFQKTDKKPLDLDNLNEYAANFLHSDFFGETQEDQKDNDFSLDTTIQTKAKRVNLPPPLPAKSKEFLIQDCSKRKVVIKLEKLPPILKASKAYKYVLNRLSTKNLIYKRMRNRYKKRMLCKICKCWFLNSNYSEHNFSHKSEYERSCTKCPEPKVFKTLNGFMHHQKLHEEKEKGLEPIKFVCSICGISVKQLSNHMKIHEIPKIKTLLCSDCPKVFANDKTLKRHINVVHNKDGKVEENIMCSECGHISKNKGVHQRHMNRMHLKIKYYCDFPNCGRWFTNLISCIHHKDIHDPNIVYKCTYNADCTREFKTKTQLRTHIKQAHQSKSRPKIKVTSNKEQEYKCYIENCQDQAFSSSLDLECHIQLIHYDVIENNSKICTKCGRLFSTKLTCQQHVKRIHGDINEKQYKCPDEGCDKYFAFETDLQNHSKVHLPLEVQRELKIKNRKNCPRCNKFINPGNLKRHLRRHENNSGDFSCTFSTCWMKFKTEDQLNNHYQLHSRPEIVLLEKRN